MTDMWEEAKRLQERYEEARENHNAATIRLNSYQKVVFHAKRYLRTTELAIENQENARDSNQLQSDRRIAEENVSSLKESLYAAELKAERTNREQNKAKEAWKEACRQAKSWDDLDQWRRQAEEETRRAKERERSREHANPNHDQARNPPPPPNNPKPDAKPNESPRSKEPPKSKERPEWKEPPKPKPPRAKRVPKPKRVPMRSQRPSKEDIDRYFQQVDVAFADYARLQEFPKPPAWPCFDPLCQSKRADRILNACPCNIKYVFEHSGANLKAERHRFHSDKFSRCPAEVQPNFKKMADEIFVVVNEMYSKNVS